MISFIVVIKNRTKFEIETKEKKIKLELFKNNIESLMNLHLEGDIWEFVVVDFRSNDVDMPTFLEDKIKLSGCSHKCITVDGIFSKGKGLNIGFEHASYETLFFLDADMMISTRKLFEDIEEQVVKNNFAMFPICFSYSNPEHTLGWVRSSGTGNAIYKKSDFVPYVENKKWGMEDSYNYKNIQKNKKIIRTYYEKGFVHQWHPNGIQFKNMYYKKEN